MEVGEPTASAPVSPLGGEHDEIERADRLDLAPRRAASAGLVARVERLDHHAFVPGGERVGKERFGGVADRRSRSPGRAIRRRARVSIDRPFGEGPVEQVFAVEMQHVEEERGERHRVTRRVVGAESTHRVLEAAGERVFGQTDCLAVEHERPCRERADDLDDFGDASGDVVEVARKGAHLVTGAVHLDSCAVELPFHRGALRSRPTPRRRRPRSRRASAGPAGAPPSRSRRARLRRL